MERREAALWMRSQTDERRSERREMERRAARDFIQRELAEGARPHAEVKAKALEEGFSDSTFDRAAAEVAEAHPIAVGQPWMMQLRTTVPSPPSPPSPPRLE